MNPYVLKARQTHHSTELRKMGGILKNPLPERDSKVQEPESISEFRKQVYKNTQLNAKLTSKAEPQNGDIPVLTTPKKHGLPKDSLSLKHDQDVHTQREEENLKWNQKNLADNEITKQLYQDIHVDEPKTPYQGAVDPTGEYYRVDDEDLENFDLGEPEYKPVSPEPSGELLNAQDDENGKAEEEEHDGSEEDAAARHKRFEEMRKKHYNIKEVLKNKHLYEDEEDDEE